MGEIIYHATVGKKKLLVIMKPLDCSRTKRINCMLSDLPLSMLGIGAVKLADAAGGREVYTRKKKYCG